MLQWYVGWISPQQDMSSQGGYALTVAGQWRTFTAFPSISLRD